MGESNLRAVMNLGNSIIGVSILAVPYCFYKCGIFLGAALLIVCTMFTTWSCKMLMRAAVMTRNHTYENLALGVYGSMGKLMTGTSVIGLNLGACIAFFVIIGDLAPPIIAQATGINWSPDYLRAVVLILAAVLVAFPLGLCRSLDSLSGISLCSLLFYVGLTIQLFYLSIPNLSWDSLLRVTWWDSSGLLKCLPIFALAFACQTQLFIIYSELKEPSFRKVSIVIDYAIYSVAIIYFLVASFGYITYFNTEVKGDILSNFDVGFVSQLFRLGFSLSVVVSFPLIIFPCRVSINSLFFAKKSLELHVKEPIPQNRFIAITAFIVFSTLTVAVVIPNVETVLGLTGATMGTLISFIFPSTIFLKVVGSNADFSNKAKVCVGVGLCVMLLSTTNIIQSEMSGPSKGAMNPIAGIRPIPKLPDVIKSLSLDRHNKEERINQDNSDQHGRPVKLDSDLHQEAGHPGNVVVNKPIERPSIQQAKMPDKNPQVIATKHTTKSSPGEESIHKQLQEDMSKLHERINQLEEANQNLKERQQVIERIQVDVRDKQVGGGELEEGKPPSLDKAVDRMDVHHDNPVPVNENPPAAMEERIGKDPPAAMEERGAKDPPAAMEERGAKDPPAAMEERGAKDPPAAMEERGGKDPLAVMEGGGKDLAAAMEGKESMVPKGGGDEVHKFDDVEQVVNNEGHGPVQDNIAPDSHKVKNIPLQEKGSIPHGQENVQVPAPPNKVGAHPDTHDQMKGLPDSKNPGIISQNKTTGKRDLKQFL